MCDVDVQGKEPSVRQLALLHFRNTITLNMKLDEALSRPRARVPPSIVQMLLVLQVSNNSSHSVTSCTQKSQHSDYMTGHCSSRVILSETLLISFVHLKLNDCNYCFKNGWSQNCVIFTLYRGFTSLKVWAKSTWSWSLSFRRWCHRIWAHKDCVHMSVEPLTAPVLLVREEQHFGNTI